MKIMLLNNVKYLISAPKKEFWPPEGKKEICIVGRSNVGKSTLINKITNNKNMAKVSKTPGLTKYLNFFDVDNGYRLVDTPGYGYARASVDKDLSFATMMHEYLFERKSLVCVIMIVDGKIGLTNDDLLLTNMVEEAGLPLQIVVSKHDKTNQKMKHQLKLHLKENLDEETFSNIIYYSSLNNSYEQVVVRLLEIYKKSSLKTGSL